MSEKKQTRKSDTAKGLYTKVRSKILKGKDGYGAVVTVAREIAMMKAGKPLPSHMVAHHIDGNKKGAKNIDDDKKVMVVSKGENTAESNMRRAGKKNKAREWIARRNRLRGNKG